MNLKKKYGRFKEGIKLPHGWKGTGRCLIDLQQENSLQVSGRQSGMPQRFTVNLDSLIILDDPIYFPKQ